MDPGAQLESFIIRFTPEVAAIGREAGARLRARLPQADVLVYDNYNALAIGFAPGESSSEAIVSIAFYPKWCSLFFLQARPLDDPEKRLKGSGKVVGHIVLKSAADLDDVYVSEMIDQALVKARRPLEPGRQGRLIIKSIAKKQRPRRS